MAASEVTVASGVAGVWYVSGWRHPFSAMVIIRLKGGSILVLYGYRWVESVGEGKVSR